MTKKKILLMLFTMIVMVVACGPGKKKSASSGNNAKMSFPVETTNKEKAINGGTLKVAIVKDSPLVGLFSEVVATDGYDLDTIAFFMSNQIFAIDGNFEVTDKGPATLTVDTTAKKATIKIKDGIKWSDGKPLVADDIIYAYEIVANKDYEGVRYDDEKKMIVGIEDYHKGKTPTISGIKKIDDKTVEISFTEMGQGIYTIGNGLIGAAVPKHHLGDVPIKELPSSEKVRNNIVTLGPYVPTKIVNGESIEFKANEHYYLGKPKIEKITYQVVNSQTIVTALKAGKYDFVLSMPGDLYNTYKDASNIEILGRQELYYSYMGFKLGHYDKTKKINVTNPNAKMNDKKLRQALAYGLNVDEMTKAFYHGLRERATSMVPPVFKKYYPEGLAGYPYNPEKAKQLLDEAGYKDVNGDGYREDKNGKPFEVRIAAMAGGDIAEPLSQFYIQNWKEIGIKAVLATGRLIEFNAFYDKVEADDKEIDVYFAAWGVGTNLNPLSTAGPSAKFNYQRYVDEENTKLMMEVVGSKSLTEPGYKAQAYKKWQEYYIDQAVNVPLTYRYEVFPINKRVKNVYLDYDVSVVGKGIEKWELTANEPIKAK